jgi:hypothetical protein
VRASAAARYALGSTAAAAIAAVALLLAFSPQGRAAVGWGLLGWSIMALIGVAGGTWQAKLHGSQGTGFLVALGTCILARLVGAAAGAAAAATLGMGAVWPYLAGLGAGYVPLQLFEVGWFLRQSRGATLARGSDAVGS